MTIREQEAIGAVLVALASMVVGGSLLWHGLPVFAAASLGAFYLLYGIHVAVIQHRVRASGVGVVHDERDFLLEGRAFRAAALAGVMTMALFVCAMLAIHIETLSVPIGWLGVGFVLQLVVAQTIWGAAIIVWSRCGGTRRAC